MVRIMIRPRFRLLTRISMCLQPAALPRRLARLKPQSVRFRRVCSRSVRPCNDWKLKKIRSVSALPTLKLPIVEFLMRTWRKSIWNQASCRFSSRRLRPCWRSPIKVHKSYYHCSDNSDSLDGHRFRCPLGFCCYFLNAKRYCRLYKVILKIRYASNQKNS